MQQDHKTTDNKTTGQSAARPSKQQNYKEFDQAYASLPRGSEIGRPSLRASSLRRVFDEFARGFNPLVDNRFGVFYGFGIGLAVGHAAWQLWHFDNEPVVVLLQ